MGVPWRFRTKTTSGTVVVLRTVHSVRLVSERRQNDAAVSTQDSADVMEKLRQMSVISHLDVGCHAWVPASVCPSVQHELHHRW